MTFALLAVLHSVLELVQEVALAWQTPLELAACFHLIDSLMRGERGYTCQSESRRCEVIAMLPSVQDAAIFAIAVLSLGLRLVEWHVPQWL